MQVCSHGAVLHLSLLEGHIHHHRSVQDHIQLDTHTSLLQGLRNLHRQGHADTAMTANRHSNWCCQQPCQLLTQQTEGYLDNDAARCDSF